MINLPGKVISFIKMNGLGNDFVIIDNRLEPITLTSLQVRKLSNRHTGIGFDQLILMNQPQNLDKADISMVIYNADGSKSDICGNATRCVAKLIHPSFDKPVINIESGDKILQSNIDETNPEIFRINLGKPSFELNDIPISQNMSIKNIDFGHPDLIEPVLVTMGNPHIVFFVDDISVIKLKEVGPKIENHQLFPEKINVSIAQIIDKENIKLRVWERGTGETQACGSAACACLAAAVNNNLIDNNAAYIYQPGGQLYIDWNVSNDNIFMSGKCAINFIGQFAVT